MKKISAPFAILFTLFTAFSAFSQSESQATGPVPGACMNGTGNTNANAHINPSPMNGTGSLGFIFHDEQCGLNYVQASRKVTTRYATPAGSGNPCTLTIAGLPNCYQTVKAYVWANVSYQGTLLSPNLSITNPAAVNTSVPVTQAGTGPSKCWGETGCVTYRWDVTACVAGNGNYTINIVGLPNPNWEIDGVTLMIIYKNPAVTYRGNITIADGCMVGLGSNYTQTLTGFTACANSTAGNAFLIVSDMQSNVNGNQHPSTLNGVTANYVNNFYNFDVANTNVINGQTTALFGTNGGGSDCFQWSMMGLYFQTTTCVTCTNSALTLTMVNTPATCSLCNGTATVTATGGNAPYTYVWAPSGGSNATATGLCPGTYTVTVTDATGCLTSQATVTIVSNSSALNLTSTFVQPLCNGQCNGTATVTVTGGTAPYTYVWSPSGGNSATGTGLCAGSYTCVATDANGCTGQTVVNVTQPTAVTATQSQVNCTCNGSCNGSASVVASGGTPGYTYVWAPSGGNAANATGLCAGTYTCTIKDANNCTITRTFTITQPTPLVLNTSFTQATCNQSNGTATVNASGGTPNYSYNWAPSGGTTANATGLAAGSYTVTVTDANGCTATATVVIPNAAGPSATLTGSTNVTCFNACNGTANVNVTGGTNPITYAWSPSGGNSANATGLCAGTYTCLVTDANGCTSSVTVTITQPTQLVLAVAGFNATCNGACNGQGVCIPSGGTPNYTFAWSPSGGTNPSATGLCAGIYTVLVTDQNGCTASDTAIVNQPTVIAIATSSTTSNCGQPDGSACANVSGGTAPYTYAWAPSAQTGNCASNIGPGTYTVTVTDFNGCTQTATVVVPSTPGVNANISASTNVTCNGACDGTASVTANGGTPPYTYAWAPSGGNTANATGLCAGTYTCTVTDPFGCSATATVTITQPTAVTVGTTQVNVLCNGMCTGSSTASASGGTAPFTYAWSNAQNTQTATGLCAGTYTVTATDANGCTGQTTVTITEPTLLTVNAVAAPAVICIGANSVLTATGNGGTAPYTFAWAPNGNGSSITVSPTATTIYTVTCTDANGCTATGTVTVTVNPLPVVTFTSNPTPAVGCAPLCVDFTCTTPNSVSCFWDFQVATSNNCITQQCYQNPGTYDVTLTVTDNNGCVNTLIQPAYVIVYPVPVADFSMAPQPTTVLNGTIQFTDLSLGSPNQWQWSFGDVLNSSSTIQNPAFTYTDSGTYVVTLIVTTQFGCSDTVSKTVRIEPDFTIFVPNAFTPNGDGNNETFFPKGSGIDENKFKMWVFDRWGNMIWYTEKWGKGWDGHANDGKDIAQEDVYVWKIEIYDYLGKKHQYVGHVSLIK